MEEGRLRKVTVRVYDADVRYLQAFPPEDALSKRRVSFNEFVRETLHVMVEDLKEMRK